jgi:hypothetical protein
VRCFWCKSLYISLYKREKILIGGMGKMPSVGIIKVFSPYLPFTGRNGSGSDETQPVRQHSQGGALGMKLLTCPEAVHYRLLVAK